MAPMPYSVRVQQHPGSTAQDIENEPEWGEGHQHRIGYKNRQDRWPGLTHGGGELCLTAFRHEKALIRKQTRMRKRSDSKRRQEQS